MMPRCRSDICAIVTFPSKLGSVDVYFFNPNVSCLDESVTQQAEREQTDDAQGRHFAYWPAEFEQCRKRPAEVEQQADTKKQEQIPHPHIAQPCSGGSCAMPALPFQGPDKHRGEGQKDARQNQR